MDPRHHYVFEMDLRWQVGVSQYAYNTVMHGGHATAFLDMGRAPNGLVVSSIHMH
jgi:hypothetical protein